jgi:phospholipid/cholesterol/gamma-HCH transport system substrate-binding protein
MMIKNIFETIIGAIVLFVAFGFVMMAYKSGTVNSAGKGYYLTAKFDKVDGLSVGSDVRMSGIKVGKIVEQTFDPETFRAVVKFTVSQEVKVPADSSADIVGDGLLGAKYLSISPGGDEVMLSNEGEIEITQSAVSFEQLIGKFIHGGSENKGSKEDGSENHSNDSGEAPSSSLFTEPLSSEKTESQKDEVINKENKNSEEKKPESDKASKKDDKKKH